MTSALGPDLLALLLPGLTREHPVAKRAVKVLPDLTSTARDRVLAALLEGPYSRDEWTEPLPAAVVDSVASVAQEVGEGQYTGWVDETIQAQLLEVLDRAGAPTSSGEPGSVPTQFADAAWSTRYSQVRTALLAHDGVTAARKQRWLRDVDEPGLGGLLKPGTEQAVLDLAVAEVRRRTPTDPTYTLDRAASPAAAEALLSNHPVAENALRGLALLFPVEPEWTASASDEQRMLRERWKTLVEWVARKQVHLWRQVTVEGLLDRDVPVDADGNEREPTEEEQEQAIHLLRFQYPWSSSLSGVLDLLPDEDLERAVRDLLDAAGRDYVTANWWAGQHRRLTEAGQEWVPESPAADEAFERYLVMSEEPQRTRADIRAERERQGLAPLSEQEEDDRYAQHLKHARWWFDQQSKRGLEEASAASRGTAAAKLMKALPLLDGRARASVRPSDALYDARQGVWPSDQPWASSSKVRDRLAGHVRTAVYEFVLPYPPDVTAYASGDWAQLAQAALRSDDDGAGLPADVRATVKRAAQDWLSYHRSNHRQHATALAMEGVVKTLAGPPPPVERKKSEYDVALEVLADLEATLQRTQREQLARADVDAAVDAALDVAVVNSRLSVEDVLSVVQETSGAGGGVAEQEVAEVSAAAVVRLAGRLEAVLRAAPGQVSPIARSHAAAAVLRSPVLPLEAVLALPAFAVFGPEAVARGVGSPAGSIGSADAESGESSGESPGERWRRMLVELVDPTGAAPGAWDRLAAQDVENRGREAWRSARAVLEAARIDVP